MTAHAAHHPRGAAAHAEDKGEHRGHGHGDQHHGGHAHGHGGHDHAAMVADFRRRFFVSLLLTVPVLLLSPLIQELLGLADVLRFRGDRYLQFAFAAVIFFYGGKPFLVGMAGELGRRQPGMMTLIALAITTAFVYSAAVVLGLPGKVFFWELATLIDVMLLGHWIEMKSVMGASGALEALVRLLPATAARLKEDGSTEEVPVSALAPGDRVLVRPGEKVPIDGIILEGRSSFNEAMLTGESKPVAKGPGDEAIGGAVNGEGAVVLEVRKTGSETYLAQVIELVRRAQETRSRTQDLANRAASWLTWVALGGGGLTLVVWLSLGYPFAFALERMVTVMVIACPHALGLAVPLVVAVSTKLTAQNGLLIRDRAAFERARRLDAVLFDKTGTLTEGRFGVTDVLTFAELSEEEALALAASLESRSEHPIARGVVRSAEERRLTLTAPDDFEALPGRGVRGRVEGRELLLVSPGYLREEGLEVEDPRLAEVVEQGKTVVYLVEGRRVLAALALADIIRPEARAAVERLTGLGVRCMMLTGDSRQVARWVARELGLVEWFAEVLPHEKAEKVQALQQRGLQVAMVGDGVNDAPALVQADLGIAIGAGTDVAVESADVVLVRNDPRDVAAILHLARLTYRKMIENLLWATGYNAVAIPLAAGVLYGAGVLLTPAAGAALMSLSTVIVAINAQLLERARRHLPAAEPAVVPATHGGHA